VHVCYVPIQVLQNTVASQARHCQVGVSIYIVVLGHEARQIELLRYGFED